MTSSSGAPGARRAAVTFIFITVMLDMLALGMVIPVLPPLIKTFRGGDTARAATTLAGAPYLLAAILLVVAISVAWRVASVQTPAQVIG